jgi:hypothetical protein
VELKPNGEAMALVLTGELNSDDHAACLALRPSSESNAIGIDLD